VSANLSQFSRKAAAFSLSSSDDILAQIAQTYVGGLPLIKDVFDSATKQALGADIYDDVSPYTTAAELAISESIKLSKGESKNPAKSWTKIGESFADMTGVPYANLKKTIAAFPPFREETFSKTRVREADEMIKELSISDELRESKPASELKKAYRNAKSKATRLRNDNNGMKAQQIDEILEKSKNRIWEKDFAPGSMQLEAEAVNRMVEAIE